MTNNSRARVSGVALLVNRILKSTTAKFKSIRHTKEPVKVVSSPKEVQTEIDPPPKEQVQVVPSHREADTSTQLSAPKGNPACASLEGLSGLCKLEDDPIHGLSGHQQTTSPLQETYSNGSIVSNVAAADSDSCRDSTETDQSQIQHIHVPVFTPARLVDTSARPPRLPQISPLVTPNRQPKLLDPGNVQRNTPVKPADRPMSASPGMVIPPLGVSPAPKLIGKILEPVSPAPDVFAERPLLPRSPRPPVRPNLDSDSTAEGKRNDYGVIGDRRVAKDQLRPQAVERSRNKLNTKEQASSATVKPAPVSDEPDDARNHGGSPSESVSAYPKPIYVGERKYYVGRYLGKGAAGSVYSALNQRSMTIIALKVIKRRSLRFDDLSTVKEELTIMRAISGAKFLSSRHNEALSFVNHLLESWYDKDCVYFVMPLCVGSLHDYLPKIKPDPLVTRVYAAELMSGVEALHDMRIIHCDLKPDNILVTPEGHLTISDFGLSVSWLDRGHEGYPSEHFRGRRLAGTDGYMAPEIVHRLLDPNMPRRGNFGFAADIWSLGVIFAELGMGGRRFVALEDEEKQKNWRGDFKHFARTMTLSREMLKKRVKENLRGDHAMLVERMLEINEADRANFNQIASHPFFSELDMSKVLAREYPVPYPSSQSVLPCQHTNVDERWFQTHSSYSTGAEGDSNTEEALGLTQDLDRYTMPEVFVWDFEEAIKQAAMMSAQQAAAQAQGWQDGPVRAQW